MMSAAVDDERIPRNPPSGARLPQAETPPVVPLSVDQVHEVAAAMPEPVRAAVVVVAGTGLRQSERFGLCADRVDFLGRELRVDQQLWTPRRGTPLLRPPKSRNSFRSVALSSVVVDALAAQVAAFGPGRNGLVFHVEGRPIVRAQASNYARGRAGPRSSMASDGMTSATITPPCSCPAASARRSWPSGWVTTSRRCFAPTRTLSAPTRTGCERWSTQRWVRLLRTG
jgi:integrase